MFFIWNNEETNKVKIIINKRNIITELFTKYFINVEPSFINNLVIQWYSRIKNIRDITISFKWITKFIIIYLFSNICSEYREKYNWIKNKEMGKKEKRFYIYSNKAILI